MAGTSRFTPRRVLWLIEWLPETSAFAASVRGGAQHRSWPLPTVLAAAQLNILAAANYQRGGGRGPTPTPIVPPELRRPGRGERHSLRDWRARQVAAAVAAAQRRSPDGG